MESAVNSDFNSWCHLCGSLEASIAVEGDIEQAMIEVSLHLQNLPEKVCHKCGEFLVLMHKFKLKADAVQEMFAVLNVETELTPEKISSLRHQYGLSPIEENLDESLEDNTSVNQEENEEDLTEYLTLANEASDEESLVEVSDCAYSHNSNPESNRKPYQRRKLEKTENEKLYEFRCHICGEEFSKMQLLSRHCRAAHQTNPQVHCWCGKVLGTWKRLMAHKSKHLTEDNEFRCVQCKITYKTKMAFDKHIKTKHGPEAQKFICEQCGKQFKERQILKNHEKVHLPDELKLKSPCPHCDKKFVNSHCLKIHIARIHEKIALHTCELCGKGCITKSDLKWHMDKHIEERNFECELCHLKFKSNNSLRIHKRRHFSQDRVVVCPVCNKEFHSRAALSNHKLVHSDVKRYKCFCGNEYKRLESYKCHKSSHTGERPFSCMWCNRRFVNSANCRKHKLKDHPVEVAQYEALHGKKGVSLAMKTSQNS